MPWEWMAKGMLLGLSIAAPLGPISILCIKKTLSSGFKTGLCCGLGVSLQLTQFTVVSPDSAYPPSPLFWLIIKRYCKPWADCLFVILA